MNPIINKEGGTGVSPVQPPQSTKHEARSTKHEKEGSTGVSPVRSPLTFPSLRSAQPQLTSTKHEARSTKHEARSTRHASLFLLLSLLLAFTSTSARAQNAPAQKDLTLIVTYGTGAAWFPLNPPQELNGQAKLTSTLKSLAEENPDAVLIDLGMFTAPQSMGETAYNATNTNYFYDMKFAAVNATAKDYFHYGANTDGMRRRPRRMENLFLSSIDHSQDRTGVPLPESKVAETPAGKLELISVADPQKLAGLPLVLEVAEVMTPEQIIPAALAEKEGPAILFSDYDAPRNDEFARTWPQLDLILETAEGPAEPRKVGTTLIQPRADETEIQLITLRAASAGGFENAEVKRVPWITPKEYESLVRPPLPIIGMSVPGDGRVAERMHVEKANVDLEVFREADFPKLTTRKNIYVYHIIKDGKPYRVIRTNHIFQREWIQFDGLVQLNPDHTISHVETNDPHYMVIYFPTRFQEVLNAIYNLPPDKWQIPAEPISGYEQQAEAILDSLRKTIELDKLLFPDNRGDQTS